MKFIIVNLLLSGLVASKKCKPGTFPTESASPFITLEDSKFGPNIEGTSVNHKGEIFATSYGKDPLYAIGKASKPQDEFYRDNLTTSYVNGVRFVSKKVAYVAEVVNHRVLKLDLDDSGKVAASSVLCSDPTMIQPNDIAVTKGGVVFTSGSKFTPTTTDKSGDIWVCEPGKSAKRLVVMGRTNGIEVSNDNRYLYVSEAYDKDGESVVQKIWKFTINSDFSLTNKELFVDFEKLDKTQAYHIDGMRFDIKGNLYVTRHGGQHVTVLNPEGKIIKKIKLNFTYPTNLEFGGKEGKELYIVGRCGINTPDGEGKGCVDVIKVPHAGRAYTNLQKDSDEDENDEEL